MSDVQERNAVIVGARLSFTDGPLDCWLDLDYGGSGQAFGGYALYLPNSYSNHDPSGPNYAGHFLYRVMEVAGVTDWNKIVGKTIRVLIDDRGRIGSIGHIIKKDWFNPKADFSVMRANSIKPDSSNAV